MDIAMNPSEVYQGISTHIELSETSFMSNLAQTIPLPDFNQVPPDHP
jgi:DNA-directed RNA polymerase I subunit RPA2